MSKFPITELEARYFDDCRGDAEHSLRSENNLSFLNTALRTAGFRNGSLGSRPSAPFRSNVYQPTEMAVVLNGGTVSIKM